MKTMNAIKKTVALLALAALVVTMMLPCFADQTANPTINANQVGSITVTKYQYNKHSGITTDFATGQETTTGKVGVAEENQHDKISTGETAPLSGVTFTLYQVVSKDDTIAYYDGNVENTTAHTVADFLSGDGIDSTQVLKDVSNQPILYKGTTGTDGTYVFSNLSVGMYVLIETGTTGTTNKDTVANKAEPVLISVPMVNTYKEVTGGDKKSNNNGNADWMYDIHVYPKNKTIGATVKIAKTGTAIADGAHTALKDVKFKLTKYKEATGTDAQWSNVDTTYTNTTNHISNGVYVLTTDDNGKVEFANLDQGYYSIQETDAPKGYIRNPSLIKFKVNPDNTIECETTFTGLEKFDWNNGAETGSEKTAWNTTNKTTHDTMLLEINNEQPNLTKMVLKNSETQTASTNWVKDTQYGIYQTYKYQLTVAVPENVDDLKTFKVTDTPKEGITDLLNDNFTVYYMDGTTQKVLAKGTDYTVDAVAAVTEGDNKTGAGFKLELKRDTDNKVSTEAANAKGKNLYIEYEAELNSKALIASTAAGANVNTAKLEYSKLAQNPATGDDVAADLYTITDDAVVYTYSLDITKYLDSTSGSKPKDVEFELYQTKAKGGTETGSDKTIVKLIEVTAGTAGVYRPASTAEIAATPTKVVTTIKTGADGKLVIQGLEKGTYHLKETKTVEGYNLLSKEVDLTIDVTANTTFTPTPAETAFGTEDTLVRQAYTSVAFTNNNNTNNANPVTPKNIINKKGFVLPQTGSIGSLLFFVVGILLVLGGVMLFFGGKKRRN